MSAGKRTIINADRETLTGTTSDGRQVYFCQNRWAWIDDETGERVAGETQVYWLDTGDGERSGLEPALGGDLDEAAKRSGLEPMLGGELREVAGRIIRQRNARGYVAFEVDGHRCEAQVFDETPPGLLEQVLAFVEANF